MEQQSNFSENTLNGGIDSSVTSIAVNDAASLSAAGVFRIRVEDEIMKVTAISGNTLTVVRGQEGTTAASHADLTPVYQVLTKEGLDAWLGDNLTYDLYENMPNAGEAGRAFIASDGVSLAIDTGTDWVHYGPIQPMLRPPDDALFSWYNQGSASVSTSKGGVQLSCPAASGLSIHGRKRSLTAPYKVSMQFLPFLADASSPFCGIAITDGTKMIGIHLVNTSHIHYVEVVKITNSTTYSSSPYAQKASDMGSRVDWFQVEDDNTNIYFRYSCNGKVWITAFQETRTTWMASPTGPMFYVCPSNATFDVHMHVRHWYEE